MRHTSKEGLTLIQQFEGFSAKPYLCPAGYLTVGYGHVVRNSDNFKRGISRQEALEILAADVEEAERGVLRLIQVPLTDGQFDALVSFTFNLGVGALQRSCSMTRCCPSSPSTACRNEHYQEFYGEGYDNK